MHTPLVLTYRFAENNCPYQLCSGHVVGFSAFVFSFPAIAGLRYEDLRDNTPG